MSVREKSQNRPSGSVHGVLVVDKPKGLTSHDVVGRVRRIFGTRRVGHAGTLDPMATGVLVILLGEATKLSSVLTVEQKTYEADVTFGIATDSLDADGKVTKKVELSADWLKEADWENALEEERNRRLQIPPQVSAIKVDGQKAYERARKGQTTELAPRDVSMHSLTAGPFQPLTQGTQTVTLRLTVSKGYYVRSLANDLGERLGVPAHLTALRRIASGNFTLDHANAWPPEGTAPLLALGPAARQALPTLQVNEEGAHRLGQGKRLRQEDRLTEPSAGQLAPIWAAFFGDRLIALVEPCDDAEFRVKRGINDPTSAH